MRALLLAFAFSLLAGCGQAPAPPKGGVPRPVGKQNKVPPAKDDGFSMGSTQFYGDYKDDPRAAYQKYDGKTVEMIGLVVGAGTTDAGEPSIALEGTIPPTVEGAVCLTVERFPSNKAAPGQFVALRGRGGKILAPILHDCKLLRVEGKPPVAFAADELAADADTDRHKGKWLRVSGEVAEAKASEIVLKTKGRRIVAAFKGADARAAEKLKPGQMAELLGAFDSASKDEVRLAGCVLAADPK